MLPTLALGIPGNAAAAALLAALELKNVVVGPTIEVDHPGLIYFYIRGPRRGEYPDVRRGDRPDQTLRQAVQPAAWTASAADHSDCVIGAHAVRLTMFRCMGDVRFGLIGYALNRFHFPTAPMVLGVILAPLADENFRRAMLVFEDKSFGFILSQWIGTALLIVVAFIFVEGLLRLRGTGKAAKET